MTDRLRIGRIVAGLNQARLARGHDGSRAAAEPEQGRLALSVRQLSECVSGAPVIGTRITPFGTLYEVVVLVDGLSGATMPVAAICPRD